MSEPATTNKEVTTADDIIQATIFGVGVTSAIAAIGSAVPFLKLPIISTLVAYFIKKMAGYLYDSLATWVSFSIIKFQTAAEEDAYNKAVAALRQAHATGDANALSKAHIDFKNSLSNLVHFDGS